MALGSVQRARLQATLACAAAVTLWAVFRTRLLLIAFGVTAGLAVAAWLLPGQYRMIQRGLDGVGRATAKALSWVLLAVVYFGLFTPLRTVRWLFRRADALASRPEAAAATYLVPLPPASPGRFERQF